MSKSIVFVTGTRADFGKLAPLAVAARDQGFAVSFFVTGMHMLEQYGLTKIEVQRVEGVEVHEFLNQRAGDPQDMILAKTVIAFSDFALEHKPDLVVIHGDRVEALACSLVCATNYIPSAHIEGGEVSGTIDEMFRHCNSKLATYHFVSSQDAKRRVMGLGETENSIHVLGSPELDFHAGPSGVTIDQVLERYEIPFCDFGIVIFHPVTSEQETMDQQAVNLFEALVQSERNYVVIAPNNDPGSDKIFNQIAKLPSERFRTLPSMRFSHFSELMKNANFMVGNSSAGVREAPFLGLPSLDIGTRQTNRAVAPSLFSSAAKSTDEILCYLTQYWGQKYVPHTAFGEGRAAEHFVNAIKDPAFWTQNLQKNFQDHE